MDKVQNIWKILATLLITTLLGTNITFLSELKNDLKSDFSERSNFILKTMNDNTTERKKQIMDLDEKIFVHFTNHEIHFPRADALTKSEFETYKMLNMDQQETIINEIKSLKNYIRK